MNADHFFTIGKPHLTQGVPCEDFALSGLLHPALAFGVVADGCSGAHANTDVGARALAYAFRSTLEARQDAGGDWFDAAFTADLQSRFAANQYTGSAADYLATIASIAATPARAAAYVFGDGALAIRYRDGRRTLIEFEWWENTPFYLQYRLATAQLDQFLAPYRDGVIEPLLLRTTTFQEKDGVLELLEESTSRMTADAAFDGCIVSLNPRDEGIEALAVLSDGISRLQSIPAREAVREFLAFKNHEGSFVKRRMLKALAKFAQQGAVPQDDLAMACIWFDGETT